MTEPENEQGIRYARLTGDLARFPFLVGVATDRTFGSGILLDTRHVLTCNHLRNNEEDSLQRYPEATVVTASGPVKATVEITENEFDLALLRLAEEVKAPAVLTEERAMSAGSPLIAAGVQSLPGQPESLVIAEINVAVKNSNRVGETVLDIQMDGGPRPGYSGGPVLRQRGPSLVCVGMTRLGGRGIASGNAIAVAGLRAFLEQHLPGRNLLATPEANPGVPCMEYLAFAGRAREGLNPHILLRIHRAVVSEKFLPAIRRGIEGETKRIVPIIAPAGYGKSTLLGEIYDTLVAEGHAVLLLRCNDIPLSTDLIERLSIRMGEAVSPPGGEPQTIEQIVQQVRAGGAGGVVLIDTLDLILSAGLVPALRRMLLALTDLGSTVVLMCRDYEYETFLEPVNDKLPGLSSILDRHHVPLFTEEEVREVAHKFIQQDRERFSPAKAALFGEQILGLSADNRPLENLIRNPLLLALTCALFGGTGELPHDLTVSRLYTTYWDQKIARSRNQRFAPPSPVLMKKEDIALRLASALALRSNERLVDSLFSAELGLPIDADSAAASADLFSEDVLQRAPSGRISFFHQTFLEYAIARWLAMEAGAQLRNRILSELSWAQETAPLHWWPVVRQLLTIAEERKFFDYTSQIDMTHLAAFRTAAFAAASRNEVAALSHLGSHAPGLPPEFQQTLLRAIEGIQDSLVDEAFRIAVTLLRHGNLRVATNAARVAGELFSRCRNEHGKWLGEALAAIGDRPASPSQAQERVVLLGDFLGSMREHENWKASADVRETLRNHYLSFSDPHRSYVVALHLDEAVTLEEQMKLVRIALAQPLSMTNKPEELRQHMASLCEKAAAALAPENSGSRSEQLLAVLHARLPAGWERVQIKAVGAILTREHDAIDSVLAGLLATDSKEILSRNVRALQYAASLGAAETISRKIMTLQSAVPARAANTVRDLCAVVARSLEEGQRGPFLRWTEVTVGRSSRAASIARQVSFTNDAGQVIEKLCGTVHLGILREQIIDAPAEQTNALVAETRRRLEETPNDKRLLLILSELYRKLATTSRDGIQGLVELSLSENKRAATKNSLILAEMAGTNQEISADDIRPLGRSRFPGIRKNRVEALINILLRKGTVPESDVNELCAALVMERNQIIINRTYDAVMLWVDARRQIPQPAAGNLADCTQRLLKDDEMNDGIVRALVTTLKLLAHTEDRTLAPFLKRQILSLITSINIGKVENGEPNTVDLLCAIERMEPGFIAAMAADWPRMHRKNLRAIVIAIRRVDGRNSRLLDEIRNAKWCPDEIKTLILLMRGL